MRIKMALVSVVICALLMNACAGVRPGDGGAPEWVAKGAGAFKDSGARVFYGVGLAAPSIKNQALRREAADNRARSELQRVFDTYSASLMKDYVGTEGELVERAIKTFSAGHLSGVEIVDHFTTREGIIYSLARMDLETFKKAMELAQELSAAAKEFVRRRADALFEELSAEELKER